MAERLEDNSLAFFQSYLENTFPLESKHTWSAVIRQQLADKIVRYLKNPKENDDKNFQHFVQYPAYLKALLYSLLNEDIALSRLASVSAPAFF